MKTRKEIEDYLEGLGIKIKPFIEYANINRFENQSNQKKHNFLCSIVTDDDKNYHIIKILNKDAEKAILNLISKSITNDDMETAITAIQVLQEESYFYKNCGNAAIRDDIPSDKKTAFFLYCQEHNIEDNDYGGSMSAYRSSIQNKNTVEKDDEER